MTTGIYCIRCKTTERVYVGQSRSIPLRWEWHRKNLAEGEHHSYKLQEDWNKWGAGAFVFEVLEILDEGVSDAALTGREMSWCSKLKSIKEGYNILIPGQNYEKWKRRWRDRKKTTKKKKPSKGRGGGRAAAAQLVKNFVPP